METILLTIAIFNCINGVFKRGFLKLEFNKVNWTLLQVCVYVWSYLYLIYKTIEFVKNYK